MSYIYNAFSSFFSSDDNKMSTPVIVRAERSTSSNYESTFATERREANKHCSYADLCNYNGGNEMIRQLRNSGPIDYDAIAYNQLIGYATNSNYNIPIVPAKRNTVHSLHTYDTAQHTIPIVPTKRNKNTGVLLSAPSQCSVSKPSAPKLPPKKTNVSRTIVLPYAHVSPVKEECSICINVLSDQVVKTDCGHKFHEVCIQDWLERDQSCPYCRQELVDIEV